MAGIAAAENNGIYTNIPPDAVRGNGTAPAGDGLITDTTKGKQRNRRKGVVDPEDDAAKRRCVSTACVACRKRKSKCDGNLPACAACSQVYGTPCIYDPNSDHRRKGVYKTDADSKSRNTTLHTLIEALLNLPEDEAFDLVRELRSCDSLDVVAERIAAKEHDSDSDGDFGATGQSDGGSTLEPTFEKHFYGKMGDLRLNEGTVRYIGGTSHLIHIDDNEDENSDADEYPQHENAMASWTAVTNDANLVMHLLNMYFTWHYPYFTTLSKTLFYRDFLLGKPPPHTKRKTHYCTSLLVNAILALGCHFTSHPGAREQPDDPMTAGDHFFREAKRLIMENDEHERPRLANIQAFALMSLREAGCGREAKGWVYSGMAFRMACDMGLNLNTGQLTTNKNVNGNEAEEDVRRITFWGCYHFDKCWSNYLGRLPQLPTSMITVPKFEVFLDEDAAQWSPYTDSGFSQSNSQPARTRAVATQISKLCEISNDLMENFYNPTNMEKNRSKSTQLKMLSGIHTRLEAWRRDLPKEMEPREGGLSSILLMHMFFQLLFLHLFRPFLKYTQTTSPLPPSVSPRKLCTQAAAMVSKLMRLYKRSHGLRQICNIAVYFAHSACTIHLLNLPDRNAKRDITHGVKHLEEIAEGWPCARRSLTILSALARKWKVALPDETSAVLIRTDRKFGRYSGEITTPSPPVKNTPEPMMTPSYFASKPIQRNPSPTAPVVPPTNTTNDAQSQHRTSNHPQNPMTAHDTSALRPNAQPTYLSPTTSAPNILQPQPQPQQHQGPPITSSAPETRNIPSPSDMFGGVEQLLRDSQDWAYREQNMAAPGFGSWATMNMDPFTWANAIIPDDAAMGVTASGQAIPNTVSPPTGAVHPQNVHQITSTSFLAGASGGGPGGGTGGSTVVGQDQVQMSNAQNVGANSYAVLDWLNAQTMMANDNSMAVYNEDEWYQ